MLTLSDVSKAFADRTLFSEVTFQINRGDRVGLVGPNGAGKSTLLRLILKQDEPDEGRVSWQRGTTVGFLPQESAPAGSETVLELVCTHTGSGIVEPGSADPSHDLDHAIFDGSAIARAKRILKGLAFRETDFDRPACELSGGWVMRAHLARLLVQQPDLLMLDEPTNHLDLETLLWFQEYLRNYPGGILLISHDREFLNQLVTGIFEIRSGRVWQYAANYDGFIEQRAAQEEQQWAAHKNQQREVERLMDFVNKFRAKNTKAKQAQAKLKQIDRMEIIEAPEAAASKVKFSFPQPETSGQRVLRLENVDFAYGDHRVYSGLDFELTRGERIVLVGPNGAGKSTLLKLLGSVLTPTAGSVELGLRVKPGYYAQYRSEMLQMDRTVLQEAVDTPARVTELYIRTLLGCFLFRDDDVHKPIRVLSGGEKSRLALVKLLLDPPNLLLLDEPTTHLDIASMDALVAALSEFSGTLVFISHDVYFIRALASKVIHIHGGKLTPYSGGYDYYLEKSKAASARDALTAVLQPSGVPVRNTLLRDAQPKDAPASSANKNVPLTSGPQLNQKERRQQAAEIRKAISAQKREVTRLEEAVSKLEARQTELAQQLEDPAVYQKPGAALRLNQEIRTLVDKLEVATREWEAAATRLHDMEGSGETVDA